MKKGIKFLLIGLLSLAIIVVIFSFVGAKKYDMKRTIIVEAKDSVVWEQISKWQNFENWSPWEKRDSNMVKKIEGIDGEVGAKYSWKSETEGNGSQTILLCKPMIYRESDLRFEDWDMVSNTSMELKQVSGGVQVTWRMWGDNNFLGRVMSVFMNMEKMVGPDYEAGLKNLKAVCESKP